MSSFSRVLCRVPLPAMAAGLIQRQWVSCDAEKAPMVAEENKITDASSTLLQTAPKSAVVKPVDPVATPLSEEKLHPPQKSGMHKDEAGSFHGMFPKRQLWQPKMAYPSWDDNWDGLKPKSTGDQEADYNKMRRIRKEGVTRHVILIRHGQYDETHKEDEKRILTEIGRKQAEITGQRIADMIKGADEKFGPCNVKILRVSGMARAKETADIIASHIPGVERADPDDIFNEGRPSHHIPGGKASPSTVSKIDEHHPRIEEAFQKIFYRAPAPKGLGDDDGDEPDETDDKVVENGDDKENASKDEPRHEFEIVVCHANVLRYFFCRALQLPPEAWLRLCTFNCSLTYMTIRPSGTVSCRMLGDIGHLPYNLSTFSQHHGYNW